MKTLWILIFFLLIIPNILAVEITMNTEYSQGETLLAKISGNFLSSLTKDNVFFYKEHTRIPIEYDLGKIEGEYYLYALLINKTSGNYSLSIENIQYQVGSQILNNKLSKNFSINNSEADFSINKGFITTDEDFSLVIQNLVDSRINVIVKTNLDEEARKIFIYPGINSSEATFPINSRGEKEIEFKLSKGQASFKKITIQTNKTFYEIPVYLLDSPIVNISVNTSINANISSSFRLEPPTFRLNFTTSSFGTRTIYIYNNGNQTLNNVSLSLSESLTPFVDLSITNISQILPNSSLPIEITFYSETESIAEGTLKAEFGETIVSSLISLNFVNDYVPTEEEINQYTSLTCAESGGIICNLNTQNCNGTLTNEEDGKCCNGNCVTIQKSSSGRIIAISLIVIIVGAIIWFYLKKYKAPKSPVNLIAESKVKI